MKISVSGVSIDCGDFGVYSEYIVVYRQYIPYICVVVWCKSLWDKDLHALYSSIGLYSLSQTFTNFLLFQNL